MSQQRASRWCMQPSGSCMSPMQLGRPSSHIGLQTSGVLANSHCSLMTIWNCHRFPSALHAMTRYYYNPSGLHEPWEVADRLPVQEIISISEGF